MLATQIEVSNGTLNIINVGIEFFEQSDITVSLDQAVSPLVEGVDYQWTGATTIQFLPTVGVPGGLVPAGVSVIVRRDTKNDEMYNIYDGGAPFSRLTLDENFEQLLRLSQEFSEGLGLDGLQNHLNMNGYRVVNLGDPVQDNDAANKHFVEDYVADILATGQGPVNNAANVVYVYPDNVARNVQTLSSYTNPALGSRGIGHYNPALTPQNVGDVLDATIATVTSHTGTLATHTSQIATNAAAIADTAAAIPVSNHAQPLMAHSSNLLNAGNGVNIIGDSISAGAYQGNVYTNGWPSLLAKAVNDQFGSKNLGAIPMDSLFNPVPAYQTDQIHAVTWAGSWGTRVGSTGIYDWPLGNTGAAAGDAINGKTVTSSTNGAYVEWVVPSINSIVNVYYVGQPGGGSMSVSVNGVAVATLNTAITPKTYNLKYTFFAVDDGQGEVTVRFTKTDSLPTELQPVIQYQKVVGSPDDHFALMNVNNFSISGRQLYAMTENSIIAATNCAALVLALGYNDKQADTDDTYYATFLQRVNWVIQYANVFKCFVVVADFCWYSAPSTRVRTQLKRIAKETKGTYIGFPDKFYPNGSIPVDTSPAASELITNLKLFADNAHPNYKGNEMIFHEVAKALGLGITTRKQALLNDLPFPVKVQGTLKNKAGDISTVTRTANGLRYSLGITATGGGNIASGSPSLCTVPAKFYPNATVRASTGALGITTAGVINNFVNTLVNGAVTGVIVNPSIVEGTFVVADNAS